MVRRRDQHDVRRGAAHLGAGHHQPEVRRRDVFAASRQSRGSGSRPCRGTSCAIEANVDAAFHFWGQAHFTPRAGSLGSGVRELAGATTVSSDGQPQKETGMDSVRDRTVDRQIAARGVRDSRVLVAAMRRVPQEDFVGEGPQEFAYEDRNIAPALRARHLQHGGLSRRSPNIATRSTRAPRQSPASATLPHAVATRALNLRTRRPDGGLPQMRGGGCRAAARPSARPPALRRGKSQ